MDLQELRETFELLGEWDARYDFITELGEAAKGFSSEYHTPEHQVLGCMSQVWLLGELSDGRMSFVVDSDAPIVKGLAQMLATIYSGCTPAEVEDLDADKIFAELGLYDHLSPNRHVGMYAMVEKIKAITRECVARAA